MEVVHTLRYYVTLQLTANCFVIVISPMNKHFSLVTVEWASSGIANAHTHMTKLRRGSLFRCTLRNRSVISFKQMTALQFPF